MGHLSSRGLLRDMATLDERARTYTEAARADRTQRAYRSDLAHFQKWTCAHGETLLAEVSAIVAAKRVSATV
jgi:hypothetical protein